MFFIFGISNGRRDIEYNQSMICSVCGKYGRYQVFMDYMYFSLFFIPIIIWNRKYYARTSCCNTVYSIPSEIGKKIRKGEPVTLTEKDLKPEGSAAGFGEYREGFCPNCGYPLSPDFEYCPRCGRRL